MTSGATAPLREAIYITDGLYSHAPAPQQHTRAQLEVPTRLYDAAGVAHETSRAAAEKLQSSRYQNSGSFASHEVILGCFDNY